MELYLRVTSGMRATQEWALLGTRIMTLIKASGRISSLKETGKCSIKTDAYILAHGKKANVMAKER
jgi:hypothetical protein